MTTYNNQWSGIYLFYSSSNSLSNINLFNNSYNLHVSGYEETQTIDTSVLVNGKPVYWLKNVQNTIIDSSTNAGMVFCYNCNNITIKDLNFSNNGFGIMLKNTQFSRITNVIHYNNSQYGIYLSSSSSNSLSNITSYNNSQYGIYLESSSNNLIYNSFFNNTNNVYTDSPNFWNTTLNCSAGPNIVGGPCIGGNFWATPDGTGFSETCDDADKDGFCDYAYDILSDSSNVDYLPLKYVVREVFIDSCGAYDQSGKTYILTQNVYSDTTCFTIGGENITLDCNGFAVTYAENNPGNGVRINAANATVKNCNFIQTSDIGAGFQGSVYINSGSGHTIINNNFTTKGSPAIHNPSGASYITISNNQMLIYAYGSATTRAIHFSISPSNNNLIYNNTIITYQPGGGIALLQGGSSNTITHNTITTNASAAHGIFLINVTSSNVSNNVVNTYAGNLNLIRIQDGGSNYVTFNDLTCFGDAGTLGVGVLRLFGATQNNTLADNKITANCSGTVRAGGIVVGESASNNIVLRNNITLNSTNTGGIRIGTNTSLSAMGNKFIGDIITVKNPTNTLGISILNNSLSNEFNNTIINTTVVTTNYFTSDATSANNYFTNITILNGNGSIRYPSQLIVPANILVTTSHLNISWSSDLNSSTLYLNTSNSTINALLNKSAHIQLRGLNFANARPIVDFNDDGTFELCSYPQCSNISYNSTAGVLEFDVVSFTTYAAEAAPPDTIPPSIQILTPSNGTWHNSTVPLSFKATDDQSTNISCTIFDNGSNKGTFSVSNNTVKQLNLTSIQLTNAKHDIYLNCSDSAGNSNVSQTLTIYFD
ncbi:MAG: right-handed parallel beta-helix repeat-containing protein, partial [Candidatus Micrarchaeota archaeon]|nr:right-handed parallel beta-helix repeat-containing protein [Candidatus Micrarchaeota archaeon]